MRPTVFFIVSCITSGLSFLLSTFLLVRFRMKIVKDLATSTDNEDTQIPRAVRVPVYFTFAWCILFNIAILSAHSLHSTWPKSIVRCGIGASLSSTFYMTVDVFLYSRLFTVFHDTPFEVSWCVVRSFQATIFAVWVTNLTLIAFQTRYAAFGCVIPQIALVELGVAHLLFVVSVLYMFVSRLLKLSKQRAGGMSDVETSRRQELQDLALKLSLLTTLMICVSLITIGSGMNDTRWIAIVQPVDFFFSLLCLYLSFNFSEWEYYCLCRCVHDLLMSCLKRAYGTAKLVLRNVGSLSSERRRPDFEQTSNTPVLEMSGQSSG